MHKFKPSTRLEKSITGDDIIWRRWYIIFCTLRVIIAVFGTGYIHPDEYFQSIEVWAGRRECSTDEENYCGGLAWEFQPENGLRSVLPSRLMSLPLPFLKFPLLSEFVSNRTFLVVLSFAIDWFVVCRGKASYRFLTLWASSWPLLVFAIRPFSNSLELFVLAGLVHAMSRVSGCCGDGGGGKKGRANVWAAIVVGMSGALGIFTRFTFVFFAIPYVVMPVGKTILAAIPADSTKSTKQKQQNVVSLCSIFVMTVAFAAFSGLFIAVDSAYYGRLTIAPLNNFMYNIKTENVAQHGLHPRWTHLAANFPILFGSLLMLVLSRGKRISEESTTRVDWLRILFPLFALSLSPHQEIR